MRVVLSMWRESYLRRAAVLQRGMKEAWGEDLVDAWTADLYDRDELVHKLATNPVELAIYLGHGRAYGWSGYRGLRWHHLEAHAPKHPIGGLISISCNNLAFGRKLLEEGRVGAFLGSEEALPVAPSFRLIDLLGEVIASSKPLTFGALYTDISQAVRSLDRPEVTGTWEAMSLLGNPDQAI